MKQTKPNFKQYEIWWTALDPAKGAETKKHRPCVILQQDLINQFSKTTLVAPLLRGHRPRPYVVNVTESKLNRLDEDRRIDLLQTRVVDYSRLTKKQGDLEQEYIPLIEEAIKIILGFYK